MQQIWNDFKGDTDFYVVYIKEAHSDDEWQQVANYRDSVVFQQPKTFAERSHIANIFIRDMDFRIPTVIDDMDDAVMMCYAAWPERIYHVDANGIITYKGKPGPAGFDVKDFRGYLTNRYRR